MNYLYKQDEIFCVPFDSRVEAHPQLSKTEVSVELQAGEQVSGLQPGHYLIHEETPDQGRRTRYLGIVGESYTVMQLTIGAFTGDSLDAPLHGSRVPGTYYVTLEQAEKDSSFRYFQREYGDDVLPHVMANNLDRVDSAYRQLDPNWETVPEAELVSRLEALRQWWEACGFEPLAGIASYTPCNALVRAMKEGGLPILHSIVPEQNWSDGKWAINHWGMPNQPFYVADDDFRKPMQRAERNVIAMGMNSYHLYMPHVVNWGDNVLSPSHYLRWHRTVESRYQPERFTNFLLDYLKAADSSSDPFFLIAGFEFGRNFGTTSMTDHNRKGLERILEAAKEHKVVFATARDVAAYYERHHPHAPDAVWTQRDYLAGTRIMGKPINSGPSIGMEMQDYKAVFAHRENLPFYFYDYTETWSFAFNDTEAPHCHAAETRAALQVTQEEACLSIRVPQPLERPCPVAVWDAEIKNAGAFKVYAPAVLDDGRVHRVLELPKGFSGELSLELQPSSQPSSAEFEGLGHPLWRVHTIGEAGRRQCILYLDVPLTEELQLPWKASKACCMDDIDRPMKQLQAGEEAILRFMPRKPWIRFWGLEYGDLAPSPEILAMLENLCRSEGEQEDLPAIHERQDGWIREQIPEEERIVYDIDCFGYATTQEKSRAFSLDRTVVAHPDGIVAKEYADGGIAFAPGQSYWCHPRGLHLEIENLSSYRKSGKPFKVYLCCVSLALEQWSYRVTVESGFKELPELTAIWDVPQNPGAGSLCVLEIDPFILEEDHLAIRLRSNQTAVLNDWFEDEGFIAALQRLVITEAV